MVAVAAIIALSLCLVSADAQPRLVESVRLPLQGAVSRIHGDPTRRIYFVTTESGERGWYDRTTNRSYRTGGSGWGREALDAPRAVCASALSVYIADRNNHRIVRYDADLRPISAFTTIDTSYAPARFGYPVGVAVNARGDLGILDGESQELIVFDHAGRFLFRTGRDPRGGAPFSRPVDLCVPDGTTWLVLDERALIGVDAFGTLVFREEHGLERPTAVDGNVRWIVVAYDSGLLFRSRVDTTQHDVPVSLFSLDSPDARPDDVLLGRDRVTVVLDGGAIEYRMEGFER